MGDLPMLYIACADASFRNAAEAALSQEFSVRGFADGISCVSLLSERPPEILLLASDIADIPAADICRDLKADDQFRDLHLILLLADGDGAGIEEALAAGCDEVLTQPVDLPQLRRQLRNTHRLASERSSLRQQASYAQQVAMTAMTSMGELGVVLQFLSKCFACQSGAEVGREVVLALDQYGLSGAVQIRMEQESIVEATAGGDSVADGEIIGKLHGVGRIFEFKTRMVINYEFVSVLLDRLPDDDEQRGRIRDNVAMLTEGANARVASLLIEHDNRRKQGGIRYALAEILEMASDLRGEQREAQEKGSNAVNAVINHFESAFIRFGLSADQEGELIGLLLDLRQEISAIGLSAEEIDRKLQRVVRSLQSIADERF